VARWWRGCGHLRWHAQPCGKVAEQEAWRCVAVRAVELPNVAKTRPCSDGLRASAEALKNVTYIRHKNDETQSSPNCGTQAAKVARG